ncbi:MAG TPA: hypothetical protein VFW65_31170 [Pseudonocardiaceae bacterium]|nr:hypothetical protein [Pseudonocardiaceae bacterium]
MGDGVVEQAEARLAVEATKTVARGGAGASTSDEILDAGSLGLDYFRSFIPPYRDWTGGAPDLAKDISTVYDNLRGINFVHFRADATQLSTSHSALSDSALNVTSATGSLGGFWQGTAAEAAQRYCGSFGQHARAVADGVTAAAQVITNSMKAIETAVLQRAQGVLPLYATDIGGVTADGVQQLIDVARNKATDDELRSVATWPAFQHVDWGETDCQGTLSQNVRNLARTDAANWLNSTFVANFDQKKQSFDSITRSTHDTVGQSFRTMNQGLGKINANPFAGLSDGIQVSAPTAAAGGAARVSGGGASGGGASGGSAGAGSVQPAADPPPAAQPPAPVTAAPTPDFQATTLAAAMMPDALGGGGPDPTGGVGAVTGGVLDGGQAVASHVVAAHHPAHDVLGGVVNPPGHSGVAGTNVTPIGQPGDAGLASAPDGALNGGDQGGAAGMPMMGGMGMGGGQGGDQQRGVHHQWRTFGHLFDDATGDDAIGGFSGTLDDGGGR